MIAQLLYSLVVLTGHGQVLAVSELPVISFRIGQTMGHRLTVKPSVTLARYIRTDTSPKPWHAIHLVNKCARDLIDLIAPLVPCGYVFLTLRP